ncbi:hypothetical protein M405DRAFT_856384 [Rhizopogon salebrosus TDB-379]|nr:hypothetical protein M405DRAFT_856384 [Rhizopogon salebrosus TDB-379]
MSNRWRPKIHSQASGYTPHLCTAETEAILYVDSSSSPPRMLQPPSSSCPPSSSMTVAHRSRERDDVIPTGLCHIAGNQRYIHKLPPGYAPRLRTAEPEAICARQQLPSTPHPPATLFYLPSLL